MRDVRTYAEHAPAADLAGRLRCSWTAVTGGPGRVLPDGCLDVIWLGGELVVAGPDTAAVRTALPLGTQAAAVRFRPGAAPAVLGLPAFELKDRRVPLAELWPDGALLERRVSAAAGPAARVAVLEEAVRGRLADAPPVDPVARAVLAGLVRGSDAVSSPVATVAEEVGLSERQLHRRCLAAFGYGAKTLDRVLRLQRVLALARSPRRPPGGLAALAAAAGYADQAHLAHECQALAGQTPRALLGPGRPVAGSTEPGTAA
jgi:AraC-like DNA-binding protein